MSSIHILTHTRRIENIDIKNKVFQVLRAGQEAQYQDEWRAVQTHRYKLQCGWTDIEVVCPEICEHEKTEDRFYLIVPEFLIPGRRYPIYVYIYAIATYCLNPTMGQRETAKRTRERFGLKTFSHTTLGRALKRLEQLIREYTTETEDTEAADASTEAEGKKFPSTVQTKDRRETVAAYLMEAAADDISLVHEAIEPRKQPDFRRPPYMGAFIDACHSIAGHTFLNYRRFLL